MAAVIGVRIVLDLWLQSSDAVIGYDDPHRQALAVAVPCFRWVPIGLLLVAGARVALGLSMFDASAAAALTLTGIWLGPLVAAFVPGTNAHGVVADAASMAFVAILVAIVCARASPGRVLLFALVGVLVDVIDQYWVVGHAWLADTAGLSVRGALMPGLQSAQRSIYGTMPLLIVAIGLVHVAARGDPAFPRRAMSTFFGPAAGGFAALGLAWGFVFAAHRAGFGLDVLHPPVVYAPVMAMVSLWLAMSSAALIARRHRRQTHPTSMLDCFALLILSALLGAPIGMPFLVLWGLIAALGLVVVWPLGAPRLPGYLVLPCAGLAGGLFYAAGYAVTPGVPIDAVLTKGIVLAGVIAAGASVGAIAQLDDAPPAGWRWFEQIWTFNLMAALGVVFLASGASDIALWAGLALSWMVLALLRRGTPIAMPGQRLLVHALPLTWVLAILAVLSMMAPSL